MQKLFLSLFFIFTLVGNSWGESPFTTGTVIGKWKLSENAGNTAGWLDSSGNSYTLTGSNSPTAVSGFAGGSGDAIQIAAATTFLTAGTDTLLNQTDKSITIGFWFRPITYTTGSHIILTRGNGSTTGYQIRVANTKMTCTMNGTSSTSITAFANSIWTHYTCVYNGTDIRIYKDGFLDNTPTTFTSNIATNAGPLSMQGAAVETLQFDDLVIFSNALSAADVATLALTIRFGTDFNDLSVTSIVSASSMMLHTLTSLSAVTTTGIGIALDFGVLIEGFTYRTAITGAPSAVTITLEGSLDCINYEILDTTTSTASSEMRHVVNKPVRCVRNNLTVLTGGTSPTVSSIIGVKDTN